MGRGYIGTFDPVGCGVHALDQSAGKVEYRPVALVECFDIFHMIGGVILRMQFHRFCFHPEIDVFGDQHHLPGGVFLREHVGDVENTVVGGAVAETCREIRVKPMVEPDGYFSLSGADG